MQAAQTREALISAARSLFASQGYPATGTEQIVAESGVGTRGALYHHFAGKRELFLAVFDQVQTDLAKAQDRAHILETGTESYRFRRKTAQRKPVKP